MSANVPNRRSVPGAQRSCCRTFVGGSPMRGPATSTGFSLVELMVALVIASLLLVGLTLLYANANTSRIELDKTSRQIESGRYAMQILSDDVRHAGYYGPLIGAPGTG